MHANLSGKQVTCVCACKAVHQYTACPSKIQYAPYKLKESTNSRRETGCKQIVSACIRISMQAQAAALLETGDEGHSPMRKLAKSQFTRRLSSKCSTGYRV